MARGKKTKTHKHGLFREICAQVDLKHDTEWESRGSTITASGFESLLFAIGKKTGIPPEHLDEHEKLIWRLLHKSLDGMILALEIINNPTVSYRLESFLFAVINAWELLLKAKVTSDKKSTAAIEVTENPGRTNSFRHVLLETISSEKDPIRMNLLQIEQLRNQAAHLFIPIIPPTLAAISQAAILNYDKKLIEWFSRSLRERIPLGMMFLVSEFPSDNPDENLAILMKSIPSSSLEFMSQWQTSLREDIENLDQEDLSNYILRIDLSVSIVNNPKKSDLIASLESSNQEALIALKYQRPIDRYPLSSTELWGKVKQRIPEIKQYQFYRLISTLKLRGNDKFSTYNFRTKKQEEEYQKNGTLPKSIPSIFNNSAVEIIIKEFNRQEKKS